MSTAPPRAPAASSLLGAALFLFIPAVLYLFVAHPAPLAASLASGIVLMIGHRFVARPYFLTYRPEICVWCHRRFEGKRPATLALDLASGSERVSILTCEKHADPTRRFFSFLERFGWPLRLGIGLPLVALLGALAGASLGSFGAARWLEPATESFRLIVGVTVQLAALGPLLGAPVRTARAVFPVHNFYLLGIHSTLWVFRLVGIWWIYAALMFWIAR